MPISTAIAASTFTALNSRNCCVGLRLLMKSISLFMCTVAAFPLTLSLSLRERIPPSKSSRIEPLNRSSRRKEALISLSPRSLSLLTSAATNERFMSRSSMRLLVSVVSRLAAAVVLLALLAPPRWSSILLAAEQRVVDPKALPKFPPMAPRDALNTFQLRKGFRLELVAAEPLITDPIALAFDEDGRLFVLEMNDYPDRKQHRGRVRRLVDSDGDGRFDQATVFAKDRRWPSAIHG